MIARTAYFFPHTGLSAARLARILVFFEKIILYRVHPDHPDEFLVRASKEGLVEAVEVDFFGDEAELKRVLSGFSQTADLVRDPRQIDLLQLKTPGDDFESSPARLMSRIRRGPEAPADYTDQLKQAQVLLYFLGQLDRQYSQVDDLMDDVVRREAGLGELLGVDRPEAAPLAPPSSKEAWHFAGDMIQHRLAAWADVYRTYGQDGLPLLADRAEAVSALDLNLSRGHTSGGLLTDKTTEVLEPLFTLNLILPAGLYTLDQALAFRREQADWFEFVDKVASKSWNREDLPRLRKEAAGLTFTPAQSTGPAGGRYLLNGYLLPGRSIKEAFLTAAGLHPRPDRSDQYSGPLFELVPPA